MPNGSIWGAEVIVSDAVRDVDGKPTWRLIPKLPSLMPGARQFPGTEPQVSGEDLLLEIRNALGSIENEWYPMPAVLLICHSEILENIRVLVEGGVI